jgi:hypothetical protein
MLSGMTSNYEAMTSMGFWHCYPSFNAWLWEIAAFKCWTKSYEWTAADTVLFETVHIKWEAKQFD